MVGSVSALVAFEIYATKTKLVYKMYKKILFNVSILTVGGGIQVSRTFIEDIYIISQVI